MVVSDLIIFLEHSQFFFQGIYFILAKRYEQQICNRFLNKINVRVDNIYKKMLCGTWGG